MSAYDQLVVLYQDLKIDLRWDLHTYMHGGYVHVTPEYALIGKSVGCGWFIRAAVGRGYFDVFERIMPYRLPYIGWARGTRGRHEVKWHDTDAVLRAARKANYEKLQICPSSSGAAGQLPPSRVSATV